MLHLVLTLFAAGPPAAAQARILEYLKANVRPGQPVVVSRLYNEIFTAPEEHAALDRLFNTFFKIPLYLAQYHSAAGKPPTLAEISDHFGFDVPGGAAVMLDIMEADPRMPDFLERDAASGEIAQVDVQAILGHPRFSRSLERTIAGWEGRAAPAFSATTYSGEALGSVALTGKPHALYFFFSDCPPCLKTAPLLVELHEAYAARGFQIVGANADRVLELHFSDQDRLAYARNTRIAFPLVHVTPEMQLAFGNVSVFPTLFFVDRNGTIIKHFVNFQDRAALEQAVRSALR